MELEKILNDFLDEKEVKKEIKNESKKEELNERFLVIKGMENIPQDEEDEDEYEDDEEEDDEEYDEDEDEDEEDYNDIDIETISDVERIKIVCDILHHIDNYYPGLDKVIMTLEDIIEDNNNY
jgi:hypothetical protein